jgi:hypothetical protein
MSELEEATLELLWSLWNELGVPGRARRHRDLAIDPEPLIAWTPSLAAGDPRLVGLAFDWCLAHQIWIPRSRLPGLARLMSPAAAQAFAAFNGALARHKVDWRPSATAASLEPGRSKLPLPLDRPALVHFRLRALSGASARSETLASLLAAGTHAAPIASLTPPGFTRRSVERVMDELSRAELVTVDGGPRRRVFRLRDRGALEALVSAAGLRWTSLQDTLSLISNVRSLETLKGRNEAVQRVEAAKAWKHAAGMAARLGLQPPPGRPEAADVLASLVAWGETVARGL